VLIVAGSFTGNAPTAAGGSGGNGAGIGTACAAGGVGTVVSLVG